MSPPFQIVSLRLRTTGRLVEVILEPQVPADGWVDLTLSSAFRKVTVPLTRHRVWSGRLQAEAVADGVRSAGATARVYRLTAMAAPVFVAVQITNAKAICDAPLSDEERAP